MFIEPKGDLKHVTFPDTIRIRIYNRYSTVVSRVTNYKLPRPRAVALGTRVFITRNALTAVLYLLRAAVICHLFQESYGICQYARQNNLKYNFV